MEHSGLAPTAPAPSHIPDAPLVSTAQTNGDSTPTVAFSSGIQDAGLLTAPTNVMPHSQADVASNRRRKSSTSVGNRLFCPVVGCPEALSSSSKHFRDFNSIKSHLNDHCTGHLSGTVPTDFLKHHRYTQCNICDKALYKWQLPKLPSKSSNTKPIRYFEKSSHNI